MRGGLVLYILQNRFKRSCSWKNVSVRDRGRDVKDNIKALLLLFKHHRKSPVIAKVSVFISNCELVILPL